MINFDEIIENGDLNQNRIMNSQSYGIGRPRIWTGLAELEKSVGKDYIAFGYEARITENFYNIILQVYRKLGDFSHERGPVGGSDS